MALDEKSLISTDPDKCTGCNKCLVVCPVKANSSQIVDGHNKAIVHAQKCINCAECVHICDHDARDYDDDTERFFDDLKKGVKISIIAAPAIRHNFPDYEKLFGYLKSKNANLFYDVSFGADITTWGYIRAIQKYDLKSIIAQPCPVIVKYVESYKPKLIPYLSPIHSPALCTAIYLNKYKHIKDKIAFLSPCIGKSVEIHDPNTKGFISYNVTYKKLNDYIKKNNIKLDSYQKHPFDNIKGSIGLTFSRPGGLKENVYFYLGGDVWVKQVEDIDQVTKYLDEYEKRAETGKPLPLLVDVLNCVKGCNFGTAMENLVDADDIDHRTNSKKNEVALEDGKKIFEYFDSTLNLDDFKRTYSPKTLSKSREPAQEEIDAVFEELGKDTEDSKKINCYACGYGSCLEFAKDVARGQNQPQNCIHYSRNMVKDLEYITSLEKNFNAAYSSLRDLIETSANLQSIAMQTKIISINAGIEAAQAGKNGVSFAVVASEIKKLSEKSANVIADSAKHTEIIKGELNQIQNLFATINEFTGRTLE